MEVGWDHKIAAKLREEKLTQDQIGIVLGIIAVYSL
jgi:predicted transcriptional regulator